MTKIGLIIQDLASDYSIKIVNGTKKYCSEHNIQLFIFIVRSKNWKQDRNFDYQHFACKSLATKHNIDGILLVTNTYCQNLPKEDHMNLIQDLMYLPVVSFGAEVPSLSSVSGNEGQSFSDMLNHLALNHSCKNIYLVCPESTSKDILFRKKVFEDFIRQRNQDIEGRIIYTDYSYEKTQMSIASMNFTKDNVPFDALACCNDTMAIASIEYLKSIGIRIPEDVKVTGFDNQLRCDFINPTLTTVNQCIEEQCYKASELLHQEILNPDMEKQSCSIDAQVVYRHSCGCNIKRQIDDSHNEGRFFLLKSQLQHYHYFLQDLQLNVEKEKIIKYFKKFGINSCVLCFYDQPKIMQRNEDFVLPEKARVYLAYNSKKQFEYDKDFYINPKENMYPKDFAFEENKEILVYALFTRQFQYGYITFTPGKLDYNTYDLIVTTTGISLATNIVFAKKSHEEEQLTFDKKNLESETYFDELTGTLNRRGFHKYAGQSLQDAAERNLSGGIIFGDMDHLKFINDNFGHESGDRAIKKITEFLKKSFRSEDLIARLGGDEFIIYSSGLTLSSFNYVKEKLNQSLSTYNSENNEPFELSISLGYVEFNKDNCNLTSLMKQADDQQYNEKILHHKKSKET